MLPKPNKIVTTTLSREFYYGTVTPFIAKLNAEGERASWQSVSLSAMQQFVAEDERSGWGKLRANYPEHSVAQFMRSGRDPSGTTQTTRVPASDYERFIRFCHEDKAVREHWTLQWLSTAAVVWYLREHGVDV